MTNIIITKNTNHAKQLSSQFRQKKLRRIYRGIYTDNLTAPLDELVQSHWMEIVSHITAGGILSFRTAMELRPLPYLSKTIVFITSSYDRTINLPGLIVKMIAGNPHDHIEQVLPGIARSNTARMLLENLTPTRGKLTGVKTVGVKGVEEWLAKELRLRNEDRLNQIRDEAKHNATNLNFKREFVKLNEIISALL